MDKEKNPSVGGTKKTKKAKRQEIENKTQPRRLKGVVVSAKMQKTVIVAVNKFIQHPKYKKRYIKTKRYKAHDEKAEYKKGDKVIIQEVRPISKQKTWKVISKY